MYLRPSLAPIALVALAVGCAEWPRSSHLPVPPDDAIAVPDDLQTLVEVEWEAFPEPEQTDDPTAIIPRNFTLGTAILVTGTLEGTGWWDDADPLVFEDMACGTSGPRSPLDPGDYIGDVDYYSGIFDTSGVLCASVEFSTDDHGWDLLLVELDECGVPMGFARVTDTTLTLGFGLGGASGGWSLPVAQGSRHALLLASYYPNDPDAVLEYRLGVSLLNAPSTEEGITVCPSLPTEGVER